VRSKTAGALQHEFEQAIWYTSIIVTVLSKTAGAPQHEHRV